MKKTGLIVGVVLTLAAGLFTEGLVLAGDPPAPAEKKIAVADNRSTYAGMPLPTPRFTIQADTNCVVDNLTGLMWARNANLPGAIQSWTQAIAFCKSLNYGGHSDWRLPSYNDLASILDMRYSRPSLSNTAGTGKWAHNDPFKNLQEFSTNSPAASGICYYWATTTTAGEPGGSWLISVFYNAGSVCPDSQTTGLGYVWPVRGGK